MALQLSSHLAVPSVTKPARSPKNESTQYSTTRHHTSRFIRDLRDITPTQSLEAFSTGSLKISSDEQSKELHIDVTTASQVQRQLGIRVAQAAARVQCWAEELEQWRWTGKFVKSDTWDEPEPVSVVNDVDGDLWRNFDSTLDAYNAASVTIPHELDLGPHQERIRQIKHGLASLEFDDLKMSVLELHSSRSRPGSSHSSMSAYDRANMEDAELLVTHVTLQALPRLELLHQLLDGWDTRLAVMLQAPSFLTALTYGRRVLRQGRNMLLRCDATGFEVLDLAAFRHAMERVLGILQSKIKRMGRQLDNMLDICEGKERLPDPWIDRYEWLEAEYAHFATDFWSTMVKLQAKEQGSAKHLLPTAHDRLATPPERDMVANPLSPTSVPQLCPPQSLSASRPTTSEGVLGKDAPNAVLQYFENAISPSVEPEDEMLWSESPNENSAPSQEHELSHSLDIHTAVEDQPIDHVIRSNDLAPSVSGGQEPSHKIATEPFPAHKAHATKVAGHESTASPLQGPAQKSPDLSAEASGLSTAQVSLGTLSDDPLTVPVLPKTADHAQEVSESRDNSRMKDSSFKSAWKPRRGPLNAVMAKRRNKFKDKENQQHTFAEVMDDKHNTRSGSASGAIDLDEQISNILKTLPTTARLTREEATPGNVSEADASASPNTRSSKLHVVSRTRARAPSLTIRRATTPLPVSLGSERRDGSGAGRPTTTTRKSAAGPSNMEGDTKLYYLTSSARPGMPQKLYVRRVGENGERVMVRVGGGWADLGEYLRSYADHHGRRAVSDGSWRSKTQEVGTVSVEDKFDLPGEAEDPAVQGASTPIPRFTAIDEYTCTPSRSPALLEGSFSGTGQSCADSSPAPSISPLGGKVRRVISNPAELGLAGDRPRELELSPEKQEWISDMVERARRGPQSDNSMFKSLGTLGNTRRVFVRKSSSRQIG